MTKICFGKIKSFALFGAGSMLLYTAKKLKGFRVCVFTSERHARSYIDGKTFVQHLQELEIPYEITDNITTNKKAIEYADGIGISFGAAWIFKKEFIDLWYGRLLNKHSANLPENRGGGDMSWRILNGDRRSASVLHMVDAGIDTGDIVVYRPFKFPESCRIPIEYKNYSDIRDREMMDDFLMKVIKGESFDIIGQNETISSYFPRLNTAINGMIDWSWDAESVCRFICAFDDPYVGASTYWKGGLTRVKKCEIAKDNYHPFLAGMIYRKHDGLFVATGKGSVKINCIIDAEGNNIMDRIRLGDRLITPQDALDAAKSTEIVYTPKGLK